MKALTGRIIEAVSGSFYVESGGFLYTCKARGLFRKQKIVPVAGDFVTIELLSKDEGIITGLCPRKNLLARPAIANIDRLIIVASADNPSPDPLFIDKLTVIAENIGVAAVIVINKIDIMEPDELSGVYTNAGYNVINTSAADGRGISQLKNTVTGGLSVLCGFSGVGKSSLLNRLLPHENLATGDVSQRLKRGRHTTRRVTLLPLSGGGYIADTPGFSSIDIFRYFKITKDDIAPLFREFKPYLTNCRFIGCAHLKEPDCGVKKALQDGEIAVSRYNSYTALYEELRNIHDWQQNKKP